MAWIDVEQNTDEWMELRAGRVGGSSIGKIMANYPKAFGKPAQDYAIQTAIERIRGHQSENGYTNAHMERGHEQEPVARQMYEDYTFSEVTNGGYYAVDDMRGSSPDGLVYEDGLIEIKCVIETVHFATVKRESFDPKYKWQLAFNLDCSGRKWIDYVQYCATFPEGKRLFVQRLYRPFVADLIGLIDKRLIEFEHLVTSNMEIIDNA